jgi:hypothetical protein
MALDVTVVGGESVTGLMIHIMEEHKGRGDACEPPMTFFNRGWLGAMYFLP